MSVVLTWFMPVSERTSASTFLDDLFLYSHDSM